ncbi:MAG: hypothetical protein WCE72_11920 [Pseudolabrys sp.]
MKVAALAAIGAFIILPAEAVERHGENNSPAAICDNEGHCATLGAAVPIASARRSRPGIKRTIATAQHQPSALDANGNTAGVVISGKTGARARVGIAYAARFQAYIDDLETNHGARVLFMGGIRPGRCSISSEHPCGKALDVCQLRRGAVDPRCNLPGRQVLGEIAASHGLFEGGRWCNSDYGHAQIGVTAAACGDRRVRIVQKSSGACAGGERPRFGPKRTNRVIGPSNVLFWATQPCDLCISWVSGF